VGPYSILAQMEPMLGTNSMRASVRWVQSQHTNWIGLWGVCQGRTHPETRPGARDGFRPQRQMAFRYFGMPFVVNAGLEVEPFDSRSTHSMPTKGRPSGSNPEGNPPQACLRQKGSTRPGPKHRGSLTVAQGKTPRWEDRPWC
jgi:hypothetical protein